MDQASEYFEILASQLYIAFSSITFDKIKLYKRFIMFYVIYSYILV